jgi:hypothetical protein
LVRPASDANLAAEREHPVAQSSYGFCLSSGRRIDIDLIGAGGVEWQG